MGRLSGGTALLVGRSETHAGVCATVQWPLSQFAATFRGHTVSDAPRLDTAKVRQAGRTIADRQMGDFSLKVQAISTL